MKGRSRQGSRFRVALVSMPWPLFDRPSLQLGTLKAFLHKHAWIYVSAFHPYVDAARALGPDVYRWISKNHWLAEAVYTPLIFPDRYVAAKRLFEHVLNELPTQPPITYDEIHRKVSRHLTNWVASIDWRRFDLIGFSVCFSQLSASLAAASRIKRATQAAPPIVLGGASCAPERVPRLMLKFRQIDFIVQGEGEQPLIGLCEYLSGRTWELGPRTFSRAFGSSRPQLLHNQIDELGQLPIPDYSDYFVAVRKSFPTEEFLPVIPLEFSRGCWWGKCTFCNLNLQWSGYRRKSASRMFYEVNKLTEKYKCLDFVFNDNALPVRESEAFFRRIMADHRDLGFFGEARIEHCKERLAICSQGGLRAIQSGIEALSQSLLRRMNKGVSVIENVAAMKNALDCGVELDGNLITEFPGSGPEDVQETLATLDFVFPYRPLSISPFYLALGSDIERYPAKYGIRAIESHHFDRRLYPQDLLKDHVSLFKDYRGDRQRQRKLWAPVVAKVREWESFHWRRKMSIWIYPPLSYRDGGDYLVIHLEGPGHAPIHYRLIGLAREIYLACNKVSTIAELLDKLGGISRNNLIKFLSDLVQKHLVFTLENQYLALAIREGQRSSVRTLPHGSKHV